MYPVLHHQEGSFVSEKNMQNVMITIIDFKQKTRFAPFPGNKYLAFKFFTCKIRGVYSLGT